MIDKATVEKIKDTADIVEVVSDYVHLVRRGSNFMGLCPFHNERTPSFSVNRRRNFCYCFSCHKGGSPVNFIMEKEGISYHDALLQLANKYGIKVEEKELSDEERERISMRESMFVTNDWALKYMQKVLREEPEGRDVGLQYFYSRGITEEAIREFRLGYCLDSGSDMARTARNSGLDMSVMRELGLIGMSQQGREYDRFHGRVIFPILNSSGKAIAFGGRDLKGGPAKYINSPESQIYVKSNELYGIYQAKSEIVRQDRCFLVEGYMDVIGMWQSGMKNVVASSGTALTDGQIALIHRFTDNVTLIYDGDAAGIKASLRGVDMLLSHKMQVKVLLLPEGKDPDEFAKEHSPEEFRAYVESHQTDVIRFKIQVLLDDAKDDPQKRTRAILSVVNSIASIPVDVERSVYIQEAAALFGVDERSITAAVGRALAERREKFLKERSLRRFEKEYPANDASDSIGDASSKNNVAYPESSTVGPQAVPSASASDKNRFHDSISSNINPLAPLEKKIIENLVRDGFQDLEFPCEDGTVEVLSVSEYIVEELEADSIKLTVPVYARILSIFPSLREEFEKKRQQFVETTDRRLEDEKKSEFASLPERCSSMTEIQREERKIEQKYADKREEEYKTFCVDFGGIALASHEDDEVRRVVNEIINDRYQLSKIYKNLPQSEIEEELSMRIYKSLAELKTEILNLKIKELQQSLKSPEVFQSSDKTNEVMHKLQVLFRMRKTTINDIGSRTISPR
ncbi:MAG: DNA primase [Muribaculum sp.]|nr:DNA primase [Muribaculum sp.]